jgi:NAD(P)-dependent dehydrogenase (short-subunit alcohol dehydrogenase family)
MNCPAASDADSCSAAFAAPEGWPALALLWLEELSNSSPWLRQLRTALLRDLLVPEPQSATAAAPEAEGRQSGWHPDPISRQLLARQVLGKVVLITGGSSGIGLETARRVAAAGATTLICGRDLERLADAERQIGSAGGEVHAHAVDLADPSDCAEFAQRLVRRHGGVDILVNNAGRSIRRSISASLDRLHDYQRTMQLNYFGALQLTLGLLPSMVQKRQGHVINISSLGVLMSTPRYAAYSASKAALDAWTRCAASEYADLGVRFTTIYMPLVRTPMIAPTQSYERVPALTPQQAAELILQAVVQRPARIATSLGTLANLTHTLAPHWMRTLGNYLFRSLP